MYGVCAEAGRHEKEGGGDGGAEENVAGGTQAGHKFMQSHTIKQACMNSRYMV